MMLIEISAPSFNKRGCMPAPETAYTLALLFWRNLPSDLESPIPARQLLRSDVIFTCNNSEAMQSLFEHMMKTVPNQRDTSSCQFVIDIRLSHGDPVRGSVLAMTTPFTGDEESEAQSWFEWFHQVLHSYLTGV
jgi:hypothetical protein